ncbi:MAG TPA: hypothetical protein VI299_24400 [Polyangiales bacterium]
MSRGITLYLLIGLLALTVAPASPGAARDGAAPLLVLVAASFPSNDVPFDALREAFKGRPSLVQGRRLVPLNQPLHSPLRVGFDRAVLGLEPSAVSAFWIDARVRDEGKPPLEVPTPELTVRVLAALANSIAYGTPSMLNPKIKALTVDGKSAMQPGYPVQ